MTEAPDEAELLINLGLQRGLSFGLTSGQEARFRLKHIVDAPLLLKQNNDPRNKIVEDGLQPKVDPDTESADDNGNSR